jgi:hypothetical protein
MSTIPPILVDPSKLYRIVLTHQRPSSGGRPPEEVRHAHSTDRQNPS